MRNLRYCILALALASFGCATMKAPPPTHKISLDVKFGPSGGQPGFFDTTASDGHTYSCRYSGGEGNGGDVTISSSEGRNVNVEVHLDGDRDYTMGDVYFPVDPNLQLSKDPRVNRKVAVIHDRNDALQAATYKVIVHDRSTSGGLIIIPCDPMIINK